MADDMDMETAQELITFVDDEGHEFEMQILDYFNHKGQEYAILFDPSALDEDCDCENCESCEIGKQTLLIMKVTAVNETEEFSPIDPDMEDELFDVVEAIFEEMDDDDFDDDEDEA